MFTLGELNGDFIGHLQAKHMLGIGRHPRCVTVPPARVDFVIPTALPIMQLSSGNAGFFKHLTARCFQQRFLTFAAARHRLPSAGIIGALHQQDLEIRRMDDDENGNGLFVSHGAHYTMHLFPKPQHTMFDAPALRAQFPIFSREPALIYLDNAATTQKPACVLDAERAFYETANANVHRASYRLAAAATEAFESARTTVARFLNSRDPTQIIFTRGATEAINLVAQSWGSNQLKPGDEILVSTLEHHANIVPWQMIAARTGAIVKPIPILANGELDLTAFNALLSAKTRLVAITQASNAIGTMPELNQIITAAHAAGAQVLVDGAQAVAHAPVDVQTLNADFYVFSGHKVYGPTGIGVLYAKAELLEKMPPWMGGGEMIERVSFSGTTYAAPPTRFEAGTPPIAQAVGLAAALDWLQTLDRSALSAHEEALRCQLETRLASMNGVRIIGSAGNKAPLVSLAFDSAHPFDVAQFLDARNIAVRVGHHCAQPLFAALNESGSLRVSFAAYNTASEVEAFITALADTLELLA